MNLLSFLTFTAFMLLGFPTYAYEQDRNYCKDDKLENKYDLHPAIFWVTEDGKYHIRVKYKAFSYFSGNYPIHDYECKLLHSEKCPCEFWIYD